MFTDETNRRLHVRHVADEDFPETTWWYIKDGLFATLFRAHHEAILADVSAGGIGFICSSNPTIDSYIGINIAYRDYEPFALKGRVRYCNLLGIDRDAEGREQNIYRVSVQLLYCTDDSLDSLKRLLSRLEKIAVA